MIASSITAVFLLPLFSLWKREVVRFFRQPSRVIGALGTPLIFWFFIGSGFGNSFRSGSGPANRGYLEYFFPGSILMVLLFTSIFSNISLIEERREGFLLGVLVAPLSRLSLVLGKILGVTTLAVLQGSVFLLLAPITGSFTQLLSAWFRLEHHDADQSAPEQLRLCIRLAIGFYSRVSCCHEHGSGTHVDFVGGPFPFFWRFIVGASPYGCQST